MEDDKGGDIRVPLIATLFCLFVTAGGVFLVLYAFVPGVSQPWYPIVALVLIGCPWLFWLFTYVYACTKGCCNRRATTQSNGGGRQVSHRQTTRNVSSTTSRQNDHNNGNQQSGSGSGRNQSVNSSKEPEMPLTHAV